MAATIFAANSSGVLVNNQAVDGVRGIDYQMTRDQGEVLALGSPERLSVYYGASRVVGRVRVASASPALDKLIQSGDKFQLVANLKQGQAKRSVSFDECYLIDKEFGMDAGKHGETTYSFTATRVREDDSTDKPPAA
jgi:hypothetical protein